jgi:Tfp pilus assembly protein PilF
MKTTMALFLLVCLGACATTAPDKSATFFSDDLFQPRIAVPTANEIFAISPEMQRYLDSEFVALARNKSLAKALHAALYQDLQLRLEYDTERTRTAAEAFSSRIGNCLSLVIMTASLAKRLGLDAHFYAIEMEENWLKKNNLFVSSGHVNVKIGKNPQNLHGSGGSERFLTIDFTPTTDYQRSKQLSEQTIAAMFMNNRAVENLTLGKPREAYWFAKAAIATDPELLHSYLALAVVYRKLGRADLAALALRHVLQIEPNNASALSNLAVALASNNQTEELEKVRARLQRLRRYQPYYFFKQGQSAMQSGNYPRAREMFRREVKRQPYNHQFHFQLALAYAALGDARRAASSMSKAVELSTTQEEAGIYAAKLSKLRAR